MTSRHEQLRQQVSAFHQKNPQVWAFFERFTLELIAAGRRHYGAKGVMERVRWETALGGGDGLKINNNFTAFYARRFERRHPEHAGFFATRVQTSKEEKPRQWADAVREHEQGRCERIHQWRRHVGAGSRG